MLLVLGAFVAGILTTLAPCVLPLLPVVVGGAVATPASPAGPGRSGGVATATRTLTGTPRALVVTAALGASVVVFTLALKASTALIGLPPNLWPLLSGGLLVVLGLTQLFPTVWDAVALRLTLGARAGSGLRRAGARQGWVGAALTGAALGPVFSSCSPLYAYLVVTLLPARPVYGFLLLLAYVVGLCGTLLLVALAGQRAVRRLRWAADPHGRFRRAVGAVLIAVGLVVLTGADRDLQAWILEHSPIAPWELDAGFID